MYLAAFIVAMVLQSIGNIPMYVLGVTYLDDASPHGTAAVHMGIYSRLYVLASPTAMGHWGTSPSTYKNYFQCTLTYTKSDSDNMLTVASYKHPVTIVLCYLVL